jgi:colicin import membrane protein
LRRGDAAIRAKLGAAADPRADAVTELASPALAPSEPVEPPPPPELAVSGDATAAPEVIPTATAEPQTATAQTAAAQTALRADEPFLLPFHVEDRTFRIALGIVLLLHVFSLAATLQYGGGVPLDEDAKRRGQVDDPTSVTVELVEAPDAKSKLKQSQLGEDAPPPPPSAEPQEQAVAQPPTPPEPQTKPPEPKPPEPKPPEPKPKPEKTAKAETLPDLPGEKPLKVEDFDVSMADIVKQVEQSQERRKQQQAQKALTQRQLAAAPQGTQSAFSKSVIAALARTKPQLSLTKGEVVVGFLLTRTGALALVKVLQSSGDKILDQMAVDAVKAAQIATPPPNVDPDDLTYRIHYVFN